MTNMRKISAPAWRKWLLRRSISVALLFAFLVAGRGQAAQVAQERVGQEFFALKDVRPGLRGIGRTIFQGNRIEEFQVEILGVLENIGVQQSVILARLSGGPLAETGVLQGMSGSPVYIDGKLLGAVALGFPFSKEPIAGIQPIGQMIRDARFSDGEPGALPAPISLIAQTLPAERLPERATTGLANISTPLVLSGFTESTFQAFVPQLRRLGFEPQEGVAGGAPKSQTFSGKVSPGSMISVQLMSGDMSVAADGTVTYVDGNRVYAFGHRFLSGGSTNLPFARSEVVALLPNVNASFKISSPQEWVGTIVSDRSTAIAGEMGRPAHVIPIEIHIRPAIGAQHTYHMQIVDDRLLTGFLTQSAVFSSLDSTERTMGAGTLRVHGEVQFEGGLPPLEIQDIFVADNAAAMQASANAVLPLSYVLGAGFSKVHVRHISFDVDMVDAKRQLQVDQAWASSREAAPGQSISITMLMTGENGAETTRSIDYRIPIGAPLGPLNFTIGDANSLNFADFAGLNPAGLHSGEELIRAVNKYRGSENAYIRVWRQEPSFSIPGQLPGGDLIDPPPSVALLLAKPFTSVGVNGIVGAVRGSQVAEIAISVGGYVVSGAKTIQVEVKD